MSEEFTSLILTSMSKFTLFFFSKFGEFLTKTEKIRTECVTSVLAYGTGFQFVVFVLISFI